MNSRSHHFCQFWLILFVFFLAQLLANVGFELSSKFVKNYNSTEIRTLIVPCRNNLGTNGSSKSIRIEFMLKRETIKNGTCNSFILCYESFLDANANNGRIRPQFLIKNRKESNLSKVCQPQQETTNNWHGIGLRICAQDNQTSAYLRTSFSKSCYGTFVQNGNGTVSAEGNDEFSVFLEFGIGSSSKLPEAKFCFSENSKGKCASNPLESPKDDLMSIKDGAMFQDLPNFWLLPLDIFLRNKNEINFQLVHNNKLNISIDKESANETILMKIQINGRK